MFDHIGSVLFHILITLFPILFYHLFLNKNKNIDSSLDKRLLLIVLIMLFMTMSFPIKYADGFNYEFRVIPIMIAFLYGGPLPGLLTTAAMLSYRFVLGGAGFYVTLLNYLFATIILLLAIRSYKELSLRKKIFVISSLFWLTACTRALTLAQMGEFSQIRFMLGFSVITWLTLLLNVFIIENLEQQRELQRELLRSEKLNVVSQLAASVAHEVRNPMTAVRGFLQLLSHDQNISTAQKRYIDISLDELDRAQSIINDYLSLAKPQKNIYQSINLSEELTKIVDLMTSYTNIQNIIIFSNIEENLHTNGNKDEIKQVLVNIMKNGIEAIEANGRLEVNAFFKKGMIHIEIKDNGMGMTNKQIEQLGTPFYSTKEMGTGVGMTICFQIIELMKGKILVESEVGKGTAFTIVVPGSVLESNVITDSLRK